MNGEVNMNLAPIHESLAIKNMKMDGKMINDGHAIQKIFEWDVNFNSGKYLTNGYIIK